ncbi:mannose-1-phosphate guanylyltransferase/mannose-6-phosphate isomerase [Rhodobacter sp. Har01]|uniref:mannose-1-phosphate guanylyltransferase/mannose-6-phosphate isomerase n=1 Tax=Rhodobacter sp. Har01 TaxID=2883999 RepID=UPI001D075190|nr:mannose-1-phosphate guanylyltransferase/mannose-6-phosphate isomerase [Rhodobacter sp. Har01]MCB6180115.1 mannose-1-phosphate guanylyltransferase/mannose-6-phosphate isomerase [Rhodobacter sp. Har01]
MIHPVILCGGSGTRLWPSSRQAFPKQFVDLIGPESLFQATLRRLTGPDFTAPLILTNEEFRFLARDQAEAIGLIDAEIVLEPVARDTAPAILSAALMLEDTPEALMLVSPSDHVIRNPKAFLAAIRAGAEAARGGALVTFGIVPDRPESGYGYLELAGPAKAGQPVPLAGFSEKPDAARAAQMIASGNVLWNAGVFLFRVQDILAAFQAHAPELIAPCRAARAAGQRDLGFFRLDAREYGEARPISIDYAVMEKAAGIVAVPVDAGWSDLGSWESLRAVLPADDHGVVGTGNVTAIGCENTLLRCEDDNIRLVGLGLKNIAAIAMRDAVLVADLSQAQQVKQVVAELKAAGVPQADNYPRFHRPWGWYETLCLGDRFQVKRIMVKPGGVLSLQSHVHRSEHWIVVAGTARVRVGEEVKLLTENQSVYIPLGAIHRMENPGKVPMYLIEVQTGIYLGEDDIQRYEDVYNRG